MKNFLEVNCELYVFSELKMLCMGRAVGKVAFENTEAVFASLG